MRDVPIDPAIWRQPTMLAALEQRDIRTVFKLLQRIGISQRRIAAMTGQSQSEISEIMKGRRVQAYDVLLRIAHGFDIPRGLLGLEYDPKPVRNVVGDLQPPPRPRLDAESGNWVVNVPVYIDSYGAALKICESLEAPPALARPAGPGEAAQVRARAADASKAIAHRWNQATRAVLRSWESANRGAA